MLDDQPLSVVNNVGFLHLVEHLEPRRRYITETATLQMHKEVHDFLVARVESADAGSFTMKSGVPV